MHGMNRGTLSVVIVLAVGLLSACSATAASQAKPSTSPIPLADMAHLRACVEELATTSGKATTATVYPTTGEALKRDLVALPITQAVSGDVYLVWLKGNFTDSSGVAISGASDSSVMWMAIPAGSPTAPCPTDDVGIGAAPGTDPSVLGPGVPLA
jgi:hypothetical protein